MALKYKHVTVFSPLELNTANNQRKAVPLHAMVALGGRGGIAPTHS
jgi:hypothetical protein